jgi:hypothetical protein
MMVECREGSRIDYEGVLSDWGLWFEKSAVYA